MVKGKVYYRYLGEYSQRQEHLGESRGGMTLSHVRRVGRGLGEGREWNQVQQSGGPKVQREQVTKMVGLCREKQPSPLGWIVQDNHPLTHTLCVCQPGGPCNKG